MKKLTNNKKGQVFDNLSGLAVGVVAFAILLTITFLILSQGKEQVINNIDTIKYNIESKAITLESFTTFGKCINEENLAVIALWNQSTGENGNFSLNSGNYTISYNRVNISATKTGHDGAGGIASTVNITYSCRGLDYAYNSTESMQNATDGIPTWIPIVIIVFIGGIILSLVALYRRKS